MRARRPKPKIHITLNEAYEINPNIKDILNNDWLAHIIEPQFLSDGGMFHLMRYEYGDRFLNYNLKVQNGEVVVDAEVISNLINLIRGFCYKNYQRYLDLKISTEFTYNPLNNTDITEVVDQTRTPNLTGSETITDTGSKTTALNNTDTRTLNTTETYNNLKDKTDYGKSTDTSDRIDYHSSTTTDDDTTYGKVDTNVTTNNISTDAVVPYDQVGQFSDTSKNTNNPTVTDTLSGKDQRDITEAKTGYDTRTLGEDLSGSDTTTRSGSIGQGGTITDAHTGTITEQRGGGQTKSSSSTGTEDLDSTITKTGFQPQYSISSRQDMVKKYREVSDFSLINLILKEIADYILLGVYI